MSTTETQELRQLLLRKRQLLVEQQQEEREVERAKLLQRRKELLEENAEQERWERGFVTARTLEGEKQVVAYRADLNPESRMLEPPKASLQEEPQKWFAWLGMLNQRRGLNDEQRKAYKQVSDWMQTQEQPARGMTAWQSLIATASYLPGIGVLALKRRIKRLGRPEISDPFERQEAEERLLRSELRHLSFKEWVDSVARDYRKEARVRAKGYKDIAQRMAPNSPEIQRIIQIPLERSLPILVAITTGGLAYGSYETKHWVPSTEPKGLVSKVVAAGAGGLEFFGGLHGLGKLSTAHTALGQLFEHSIHAAVLGELSEKDISPQRFAENVAIYMALMSVSKAFTAGANRVLAKIPVSQEIAAATPRNLISSAFRSTLRRGGKLSYHLLVTRADDWIESVSTTAYFALRQRPPGVSFAEAFMGAILPSLLFNYIEESMGGAFGRSGPHIDLSRGLREQQLRTIDKAVDLIGIENMSQQDLAAVETVRSLYQDKKSFDAPRKRRVAEEHMKVLTRLLDKADNIERLQQPAKPDVRAYPPEAEKTDVIENLVQSRTSTPGESVFVKIKDEDGNPVYKRGVLLSRRGFFHTVDVPGIEGVRANEVFVERTSEIGKRVVEGQKLTAEATHTALLEKVGTTKALAEATFILPDGKLISGGPYVVHARILRKAGLEPDRVLRYDTMQVGGLVRVTQMKPGESHFAIYGPPSQSQRSIILKAVRDQTSTLIDILSPGRSAARSFGPHQIGEASRFLALAKGKVPKVAIPKPKINFTPAAKMLASRHDIDLAKVEGSGKKGKIIEADIDKAIFNQKVQPLVKTIMKGKKPSKEGIKGLVPSKTALDEAKNFHKAVDVHLTRPIRLLDWLDGYAQGKGPHTKKFWNQISPATYKETVATKGAEEALRAKIASLKIDPRSLYVNRQVTRSHALPGLALMQVYMATQDPHMLKHLMSKFGNNFSQELIDACLKRITPQERALADWLLDWYEAQYDSLNEIHKKLKGTPLTRVSGRYSHIIVRRDRLPPRPGEKNLGPEELLRQDVYRRGQVEQGVFMERQREGGELVLDALQNFHQSVSQIEHIKNFALIVNDLQPVLRNPNWQKAVIEKLGRPALDSIQTWFDNACRVGPMQYTSEFGRAADFVRRHAAMSMICLNMLSMMRAPVSFLNSIGYGGPSSLFYHVDALYQLSKNPMKLRAFVLKRSEWIKYRFVERELRATAEQATIKERLGVGLKGKIGLPAISRVGSYMYRFCDYITVTCVWKAHYDRVMARSTIKDPQKREAEAIRQAERAVEMTQPMASAKDLPGLWRMGALARMFTLFKNQVSQNWNILRHDMLGQAYAGKISPGMFAWKWMMTFLFPSFIFSLIGRGRLPTKGEAIKDVISYQVGTVFFGGYLLQLALRGYSTYEIAPLSFASDISEFLATQAWKRKAQLAGSAVAKLVGIPWNQPQRVVRGVMDLSQGKTTDFRRLIWSEYQMKPAFVTIEAFRYGAMMGLVSMDDWRKVPATTPTGKVGLRDVKAFVEAGGLREQGERKYIGEPVLLPPYMR